MTASPEQPPLVAGVAILGLAAGWLRSYVYRPRYHRRMTSPANTAITAPAASEGPNGIGSFRERLFAAISSTPAVAPIINASSNATAVAGHLRKAPIIAATLMSPPPMPPGRT